MKLPSELMNLIKFCKILICLFITLSSFSQSSSQTFKVEITNTNNSILEISSETLTKLKTLGFNFTTNSSLLSRNYSELFDFNNDGFKDIVWIVPKNPSIGSPLMIFLWDNNQKKYIEQTSYFVLGHGDHMMYYDTIYDFDQDGDLDIYFPMENYHGPVGQQAPYFYPGGNFMPGNMMFNENTYLKRVYIDTTTVNYAKKDYPAYWQASLIDYDSDNIKDLIVPTINQRPDSQGFLAAKYSFDNKQNITKQFVFPWPTSENYKGQTHSMIFKNYKNKIYAFLQPKEDYPDGKTTFYYYTYPEVWIFNKSTNGKPPELINKIELKRNLNLLNQGQIMSHDGFYIVDLDNDGKEEYVLGMYSLPQTNEHWAIHIFDQSGTEITDKWFSSRDYLEGTKSNGNGFEVIDLNGDGFEDIISRDRFNSTDADIPLFLNNKSKFEKYVLKTDGPSGFNMIVDINNDGYKEVLKINESKIDASKVVTHYTLSYKLYKDLDDDGDGVKNEFDQCPYTTKGAYVDKLGCEIILGNQVVEPINSYPNPIHNYFIVQYPQSFGDAVHLTLLNSNGQEILHKNNIINGQHIPTESLPAGSYLLKLQSTVNPNYQTTTKIIKN